MCIDLVETSLETMFEPPIPHARSIFVEIEIIESNLKVLLYHFKQWKDLADRWYRGLREFESGILINLYHLFRSEEQQRQIWNSP